YEWTPKDKSLRSFSERTQEVNQSFEFPTNYFLRGSKLSTEKEITENEFRLTELNIIAQIKSAYFNVLAKENQLKIAEENLAIAEDFFKKAEIRYNVGEGTNLEKLTAKVQFTEAKNNAEVQKNLVKTAYAELNYVLGYGKEAKEKLFVLSDSLTYHSKEYTLEGLVNDAEKVNPQLKVSELKVSSSSVSKTLAWSSLLPNFNLAYFKQTRDGDNGFYGASFGISVPLWFMFDQRGQIQEATANVSIAESELQFTKNSVYLRIKNALTEFQNADRQVQLYVKDILPQADEVYRTASKSYDAGEITYLEFLQAKQTLINSRNNYINALLAHNVAIATLEQTVGNR
ncbi:MAG: TolC family protein, partial [Melioribacteraceae bacterium]